MLRRPFVWRQFTITIDLAAGTYSEAGLVIDKALNFQGAGVVVQ